MQKRNIWLVGIVAVGILLGIGMKAAVAEEAKVAAKPSAEAVLTAIQDNLKTRVIASGTLDIYDEKINAVRNLRMTKLPEKVEEKDGVFTALVEYRDIKSGDMVTVEAAVDGQKTPLAVKELKMVKVEKNSAAPAATANKEFTDAEIQSFMKNYIDQQVKFTGTLMLFDQERKKMCSLQLVSLDSVVKRMGIFFSSRAEFKDTENGDILAIDVSVENKQGALGLQALRIREVKRAPKP